MQAILSRVAAVTDAALAAPVSAEEINRRMQDMLTPIPDFDPPAK